MSENKDKDIFEDEDGWINYIRRNLQHSAEEESPFPDSSWSYTRHDSPFEKDSDGMFGKRSDSAIMEDVTDALYRNTEIDASYIKALVLNGIVSLFGTVRSSFEKREAERTVSGLSGVWSVRNDLTIEEDEKRSLTQNTIH